MNDDKFINLGDTIKFIKSTGVFQLVDGQHRLKALIAANKTYSFLAVLVEEKAISFIDSFAPRTRNDVVSILGTFSSNDSAILAPAAIALCQIRNRTIDKPMRSSLNRGELVPFLNSNPQLYDTLKRYHKYFERKGWLIFKGLFLGFICYAMEKDSGLVDSFLIKMLNGVSDDSDPCWHARNLFTRKGSAIVKTENGEVRKYSYPCHSYTYRVLANTWNKLRSGKKIIKYSVILERGEGFVELI
jgi:hypothetical protein